MIQLGEGKNCPWLLLNTISEASSQQRVTHLPTDILLPHSMPAGWGGTWIGKPQDPHKDYMLP